MAGAIVETRQLSKWYGQVVGLLDATFELPRGIVGLLGPNGAGKSTLMGLVTGQLRPSQGELRVLGQPVWGNHDLMRRIGLCPEQDAFYETMSGASFVATMLRLQGYGEAESRTLAAEALELVGMGELGWKRLGAMSKGMRQRVKLAQALAHRPELLVLDEPLNGMDPVGRLETIDLVKALGKAGKSVLVSSHVLHEVEAMTRSILLIHHGRVRAHGDVHEIRALLDEHPHHIAIRCGAPRDLAAALLHREDVVSVDLSTEGGAGLRVIAKTTKPDLFYTELPATAHKLGIDLEEITSPDDNLAAVFDYLVGQ